MAFKLYSKDQDLPEAVFTAVMYWRIAYGGIRVFVGYKLLSLVGLPAVEVYQHFFRRELAEDPGDFIFNIVGHMLSQHGFSITYFIAAYLLFWGTLDIILSISMLRHYLWAFYTSMVIMGLFVVYELFRYSHTHSPVLLSFIFIDLFIIYMVSTERERLVKRLERREQKELATQI